MVDFRLFHPADRGSLQSGLVSACKPTLTMKLFRRSPRSVSIGTAHLPSVEMTGAFFLQAAIFSAVAALVVAPGSDPDADSVLSTLLWLVPVIVIMIISGTFASLWRPKYLSPDLVGLLFMSEIVVGVVSVALLSGESFGSRELIGVLPIAGASPEEPHWAILSVRRKSS